MSPYALRDPSDWADDEPIDPDIRPLWSKERIQDELRGTWRQRAEPELAILRAQYVAALNAEYATDEREEHTTNAPAGLVNLASRERREHHETAVCVDNTVSRDVADPGRGNPPGAMGDEG